MKAVIFSFIPVSNRSMVASTRIAGLLNKELDLPIFWDDGIAEHTNLDALIIVNGAFAFCKALEPLSLAILGAKRIVWVQNDYTIGPPINNGHATSPFRKAFVARRECGKPHLEYWSTCDKESKATALSAYINWNALSMREKPLPNAAFINDVCYYGSFRLGRAKYFDQFFNKPKCRITISSPSKKFAEIYRANEITHMGIAEDLLKWLSEHGLGLYLEDRKSHNEFHSPPNRFYEMLSAGLPMAFQQEAGMTLRKAGYNTEPYIARNGLELSRMLRDRDTIKKQQREKWYSIALAERNAIVPKLLAAYKKLQGAV